MGEITKYTKQQMDKVTRVYEELIENPQEIITSFTPGISIVADDYVQASENLKKYVVIDNLIASGGAIFHSDKKIPVNAFRLIMIAISEVNMQDNQFRTLFVSYKDLAKIYNIDARNVSRMKEKIRDSIEAIKLRFSIYTDHGTKEFSIPFVGLIAIDDEQKGFYIRLNQYIAPFFIQLQDSFTRVEQQVIAQLNTVPSMQILLLIKQKMMSGWPTGSDIYTVEIPLEQVMGVTGNKEWKPNDFMRFILDPFVENIERINDWVSITYEPVKEHDSKTAKITSIKFIIQNATRKRIVEKQGEMVALRIEKRAKALNKWASLPKSEKIRYNNDFEEFCNSEEAPPYFICEKNVI